MTDRDPGNREPIDFQLARSTKQKQDSAIERAKGNIHIDLDPLLTSKRFRRDLFRRLDERSKTKLTLL